MKIAIVLEDFALGSAGQQVLDRFIIGYSAEGQFYARPAMRELVGYADNPAALSGRSSSHGLLVAGTLEEAVAQANGAIVVSSGPKRIQAVLAAMQPGSRCFVVGQLGDDADAARESLEAARSRNVSLCSGAGATAAFRLPEASLSRTSRLKTALVVGFGDRQGETDALEGLSGFAGYQVDVVQSVQRLEGENLWRTLERGGLLAAAVSRSNTIQGDPVRDGRTQDVAGLGLLARLAKSPRAWELTLANGSQILVAMLTGALEDINVAATVVGHRDIISTQLYRPPPPMREEYSNLAAIIDEFFRTGREPWPAKRAVFVASALGMMADVAA